MIPTLLANMFDAEQTAKPDKFIWRGVGRNQMSQRDTLRTVAGSTHPSRWEVKRVQPARFTTCQITTKRERQNA